MPLVAREIFIAFINRGRVGLSNADLFNLLIVIDFCNGWFPLPVAICFSSSTHHKLQIALANFVPIRSRFVMLACDRGAMVFRLKLFD